MHRDSAGEKYILPELAKMVHALAKKHHVIVATGRRYRATLTDLQQLPPMDFVIAHNGLVIRDGKGKLRFRRTLEIKTALEIAKLVGVHREDFFFVADGFDDKIDYLFTKDALQKYRSIQLVYSRGPEHCHLLDSLDDLKALSHLPVLEVAALGNPLALCELRDLLNPVLPKQSRGFVVKNIGVEGLGALEIFDKEFSKWTAIEWVKKMLQADRVVAVGDDENDIEMLRYADMGVAMGHAEPRVLEAAKHRVDGPQGLVNWLRNFDH